MKFTLAIGIFLFIIFSFSSEARSKKDNVSCGIVYNKPLTNAYGPFDYTNPKHHDHLPVVLEAHFTPSVERLTGGNTGTIMGDINYTLHAIPNYHRALYAVGKLQRRKGKLRDIFYSAECYFKRAIYFQPRDEVSKMLFAMHLHLTGSYKQAKALYQQALAIRPRGAELNYNYGLLLVDMEQYQQAKKAAKIAYRKGYPLQGLKKKLANY